MKKKYLKIIAFVLILAGSFVACKKTEENPLNGIVGKWHLLKISISINYGQPEITGFSEKNIIYEFCSNNKLVVTGNIPDDLFIFDGFQKGEHFYEYSELIGDSLSLPGANLIIDEPELGDKRGRYYCGINSNNKTMSIGGHKTIGSDFYNWHKTFVKLNNTIVDTRKMILTK